MERDDRQHRDEPQAQTSEIVRNLVEPDEISRERLFGKSQTKSSTTFPSNKEGRDGDDLSVIIGGKVWICKKVRGKWHRQEFGSLVSPPLIEKSITKALAGYSSDGGIEEAPVDDFVYGRKASAWEVLQTMLVMLDATIDGNELTDDDVTIENHHLSFADATLTGGELPATAASITVSNLSFLNLVITGNTLPEDTVTINGGAS